MDLYCARSLKQQSADRHVVPFGHTILIPIQTVFDWGLNQRSITLEASTLNITPPMRLNVNFHFIQELKTCLLDK
jgi:hypothetical protein